MRGVAPVTLPRAFTAGRFPAALLLLALSATLFALGGCAQRAMPAVAQDTTALDTSSPATAPQPSVRVMSFNIRYDNPDDGDNAWPHRRDAAASMIRFHRADVAGLQLSLLHI